MCCPLYWGSNPGPPVGLVVQKTVICGTSRALADLNLWKSKKRLNFGHCTKNRFWFHRFFCIYYSGQILCKITVRTKKVITYDWPTVFYLKFSAFFQYIISSNITEFEPILLCGNFLMKFKFSVFWKRKNPPF